MAFIPRQVKPPARLTLTTKVPEELATLIKHYAEFVDSTQEYVIVETLRLAFRRDKEFQAWLATTHPGMPATGRDSRARPADQPRPTPALAAADPDRLDPRRERSGS